eukprot:gnl/MRDRNA2_/MRDRNA2_87481_c0_seq1.p1 gnl/MRDRNA2_/MRDRNA2_87481_c0~~gnl/MRDRNA2_/MRDRNA2_87481_c0_seq1.p1  ORF type:complete len:150 (+),score=45.84 gnl/MRDRNA2_/MRDRNA2_87481_c0_seq1:80-529(+)
MAQAPQSTSLFTDVHRWLALQADEIEMLKARHQRNDEKRKAAIAQCNKHLQRDVQERKKQLSDFSIEMEKYTLRKIDMLHHELAAHHLNQKHDDTMQQQQINRLCDDLDALHESLYDVAASMKDMVKNCVEPEQTGNEMAVDAPKPITA